MAELLKNQYYQFSFYKKLGEVLESHIPDFKKDKLYTVVQDTKLVEQDLKTKMYESARLLHGFLPQSFSHQLSIVLKLGPVFGGLEGMFLPAWVELYGKDNIENSVNALCTLTQFSSSEFAIRPFIIQQQSVVLNQMLIWAEDENEHVRRLASEGCRPRLPWSMALPELKKDPTPIFPILDRLKEDESLYVRKSVANNINDITKDNPDLALKVVEGWGVGKSEHTDWIIRHGLRSLIKSGNQRALKLLGYEKLEIGVSAFNLKSSEINLGEELNMELVIVNQGKASKVMIDYVIHFVRDKGKIGKKVFKWKSLVIESKQLLHLDKVHSFRPINTRKYYSGEHMVKVQINGELVASKKFRLSVD